MRKFNEKLALYRNRIRRINSFRKKFRDAKDLKILNKRAASLNAEAKDALDDQADL